MFTAPFTDIHGQTHEGAVWCIVSCKRLIDTTSNAVLNSDEISTEKTLSLNYLPVFWSSQALKDSNATPQTYKALVDSPVAGGITHDLQMLSDGAALRSVIAEGKELKEVIRVDIPAEQHALYEAGTDLEACELHFKKEILKIT